MDSCVMLKVKLPRKVSYPHLDAANCIHQKTSHGANFRQAEGLRQYTNWFIEFPMKPYLGMCRLKSETGEKKTSQLEKIGFSQDSSAIWLKEWERGWKAVCFCLRVRVGISQNEVGSLQSLWSHQNNPATLASASVWWERKRDEREEKRERGIWTESATATCE